MLIALVVSVCLVPINLSVYRDKGVRDNRFAVGFLVTGVLLSTIMGIITFNNYRADLLVLRLQNLRHGEI